MALSNYEKQKRWRDKNRVLYNLQQRQRRKKTKGGAVTCSDTASRDSGNALPTVQPASRSTIDDLRKLIESPSSEPVETPVKPLVFRDDYGRVISEAQWKRLQERKASAKEAGYEIDAYSQ